LYMFYEKGKNYLWCMLPLFILWANFHGGYIIAIMFLGVFIFGEFLDCLQKKSYGSKINWQPLKKVLAWGVISILCMAINPIGYKIFLIPFQTIGVEALQLSIEEWASPDFHEISQQFFLMLFFLFIFTVALGKEKPKFREIFLILWFAYMGFVARRNIPIFIIISLPIITKYTWLYFSSLTKWDRISKIISGKNNRTRSFGIANYLINLTIVFIMILTCIGKFIWISNRDVIYHYEKIVFPREAMLWIQNNAQPENLFNEYAWGGYLIWNLDEYSVFIDGRTDLYGDEIIRDWKTITNADKGWNFLLDKYKINTIFIKPDRQLTSELKLAEWQIEYEDQIAIIMTR
ncbi:MAG: hypothetical protein JEZ03_14375, partial [Bacteroidales bacterium]|nr:hypothetical protein [Bacteroidales bacterium]